MSPSSTHLRRSAALIASGVAILLGAGSAQAAENGKIAFERFGEIFLANPDGKNATNLTATKTSEDQAVFSPDGTKIAFVRDSVTASLADDDLWVMNADGTGQVQIADAGDRIEDLHWSGDGTRLLYWADRDATEILAELYSVKPDGSGDTLLSAEGPPIDEGRTTLTAAGDKVAWVDDTTYGNPEIVVSRIDVPGITRITNDPGDDVAPVLSPDAMRIAWSSDRDHPGENGGSELYIANADGTIPARVTSSGAKKGNYPSAFSPDGARIGYDHGGFAAVIGVDGTSPVTLTNEKSYNHFERFSPDGTRALYEHTRPIRGEDPHYTLDTVRLDGGGHKVVVGKDLDPVFLDWGVAPSPITPGPLELSLKARSAQRAVGLRIGYTCSNECDLTVVTKGETGDKRFKSKVKAHGYGNDAWQAAVISKKARAQITERPGAAKIVVTATDQFGDKARKTANVSLNP